jgi:hypothetical protein
MKKEKKKRTISAAQRAALARGRAMLSGLKISRRKHKRLSAAKTLRVIPEKLEPIIIKGGSIMKRRKGRKARKIHGMAGKSRRHSRRVSGLVVSGRRTRRARRYHGSTAGRKLNVAALTTEIVGVGAGAVAGSFIANKVPGVNAKMKAFIPIALGVGIGMTKYGRSPIVKSALAGSIAVGTLALVKAFFPTLPLLTGTDDAESVMGVIDNLPDEEKALLGMVVNPEMEGEDDTGVETYGVVDAPLSALDVQ